MGALSTFFDAGAWALRRVDPETAHAVAVDALAMGFGPAAPAANPVLATSLAGMELMSPIGLAAGFDKDARAFASLLRLGFGFVECGTVTPRPQDGNPRPRMFRLEADRAIINRLGFNNAGLAAFVPRLAARRPQTRVVGANVGANRDTADRAADYVAGLQAVYPFADYVSINVSSPNTPGLRALQSGDALDDLLGRLCDARAPAAAQHGRKPMFLKVAPDLTASEIEVIAQAAHRHGVDGLIVSNTTVARPASLRSGRRSETGGVSGPPLFEPSLRALRAFRAALGGALPLIGVGGVACAATALAKIKAGASAVQLYTALIYEGPSLPARINRDLAMRLKAEGFAHVADAVGVEAG